MVYTYRGGFLTVCFLGNKNMKKMIFFLTAIFVMQSCVPMHAMYQRIKKIPLITAQIGMNSLLIGALYDFDQEKKRLVDPRFHIEASAPVENWVKKCLSKISPEKAAEIKIVTSLLSDTKNDWPATLGPSIIHLSPDEIKKIETGTDTDYLSWILVHEFAHCIEKHTYMKYTPYILFLGQPITYFIAANIHGGNVKKLLAYVALNSLYLKSIKLGCFKLSRYCETRADAMANKYASKDALKGALKFLSEDQEAEGIFFYDFLQRSKILNLLKNILADGSMHTLFLTYPWIRKLYEKKFEMQKTHPIAAKRIENVQAALDTLEKKEKGGSQKA